MKNGIGPIALGLALALSAGCRPKTAPESLKRFPVDSMEGVLTQSGVSLDKSQSSDGKGSLKIEAAEPVTVRLYEVRGLEVENARLTYRARLKTSGVTGQAYLEMWCVFPGQGEFFSRGLHAPLTGTVDWTTQEIPFFLKSGQKPELIKLNVAVTGKGTVWIDDIELTKGPL